MDCGRREAWPCSKSLRRGWRSMARPSITPLFNGRMNLPAKPSTFRTKRKLSLLICFRAVCVAVLSYSLVDVGKLIETPYYNSRKFHSWACNEFHKSTFLAFKLTATFHYGGILYPGETLKICRLMLVCAEFMLNAEKICHGVRALLTNFKMGQKMKLVSSKVRLDRFPHLPGAYVGCDNVPNSQLTVDLWTCRAERMRYNSV